MRAAPYIKPHTYGTRKKRNFKQDIGNRENMGYAEAADTCTCHAGRLLFTLYIRKQNSKLECKSKITVYECEDCGGWSLQK